MDDAKRQIETANLGNEKKLLEDQKDLLNEQIDIPDERADAINKYYDEQKLKEAYLNIVYQLNAGNDDVLNALRKLSEYNGTAPAVLSDSNTELDEMNGKLDKSNTNVGNVNTSLGKTASTTSDV